MFAQTRAYPRSLPRYVQTLSRRTVASSLLHTTASVTSSGSSSGATSANGEAYTPVDIAAGVDTLASEGLLSSEEAISINSETKRIKGKRESKDPLKKATEEENSSTKSRKRTTKGKANNSPRLNPFDSTERWLNDLRIEQHSGHVPTLDDVERFRRYPPSTSSAHYADEYNGLVDRLCEAFSRSQLRAFGDAYQLDPALLGRERSKAELAETIIERKWGWPSLNELMEQEREKREVATKSFPLKSPELFLILGKDGSDLYNLSKQFNVQASLSSKPFGLRIRGTLASLRDVGDHIARIKAHIRQQTLEVPFATSLHPRIVQNISRLSNVYFENVLGSEGQVRFFATDEQRIPVAARLATSAASELRSMSSTPLLSHLPAVSADFKLMQSNYSLYPFLTTQALPFTVSGGGAFRLRRVGDWLSGDDKAADRLEDSIQNLFGPDQRPVNLQQALLEQSGPVPAPGGTREVTALTGHILFAPSASSGSSFLPPVAGSLPFDGALQSIESAGLIRAFVPSVPPAVMDVVPSQSSNLRRLTYQVISSETLSSQASGTGSKILTLDIPINPDSDAPITSEARCLALVRNTWDIVLPHRATDLRIVSTDTKNVPHGSEPDGIRTYLDNLHSFLEAREESIVETVAPVAPAYVYYEGERYALVQKDNVRQSTRHVAVKLFDSDFDFIESPSQPSQLEFSAVSERMNDVEIDTVGSRCEVSCHDTTSEVAWTEFLRNCDYLTKSPTTRAHLSTITSTRA